MYCTYCGKNTHTVALCPSTANGSSARVHLRCNDQAERQEERRR